MPLVLWHKRGCGSCVHQRTSGATISEHAVVSCLCLTVSMDRFHLAFGLKVLFLANSKNKEMDLESIQGKSGQAEGSVSEQD